MAMTPIPYSNAALLQYPYPINGMDPALFPFHIAAETMFEQYIATIPWNSLMGTGPNHPIVTRTVKTGDGFQYRVPKMNAINHTQPVTNYNQIRGQAQTPTTDVDFVTTGQISFPCKIENDKLTSFGTPIQLRNYIVEQILEACALNLSDNILQAATTSAYPDLTAMKPSYDRVILAGNPTYTRQAYNQLAGGLIGVLNAALTAGVSPLQNGLSAKTIMQATGVAAKGGKRNGAVLQYGSVIEDQIRPAKLMTKGGWDMKKYLGFFDPDAIPSLYDDQLFQATGTARGTVTSDTQPEMISGADYIGEYSGVYLHKVGDLSQYQIVSGGNTYSWGFLIGAGAWDLGWGEHPSVSSDYDPIERSYIWASHEERGQKMLMFPAKQPAGATPLGVSSRVEQGIIHIFTKIS